MNKPISDQEIRTYLNHRDGNRKVRVKVDGTVEYYGSPKDTDRQHDYWHYYGKRSEVVREIERYGGAE